MNSGTPTGMVIGCLVMNVIGTVVILSLAGAATSPFGETALRLLAFTLPAYAAVQVAFRTGTEKGFSAATNRRIGSATDNAIEAPASVADAEPISPSDHRISAHKSLGMAVLKADVRTEVLCLLKSSPFQPFRLLCDSGSQIVVRHPSNVAYDGEIETANCCVLSAGVIHIVAWQNIVSVVLVDDGTA